VDSGSSREVVTRADDGHNQFNTSKIVGQPSRLASRSFIITPLIAASVTQSFPMQDEPEGGGLFPTQDEPEGVRHAEDG
jgi:hypothetical protein